MKENIMEGGGGGRHDNFFHKSMFIKKWMILANPSKKKEKTQR